MPRKIIYNYLLHIRIPLELLLHAKEVAKEQGMNISAFVRQALRRNIDLYVLHEKDLLKKLVGS